MTAPVPPADLINDAAVFVRLVADANTAISSNRPIPREMQGRTRADVARGDMHPAVGRALADWLDEQGALHECFVRSGLPTPEPTRAVAVARAVLGNEDPT